MNSNRTISLDKSLYKNDYSEDGMKELEKDFISFNKWALNYEKKIKKNKLVKFYKNLVKISNE